MTGTTPIEDARLRTVGFSEIQRLIREVDAAAAELAIEHAG